MSFAFERRSFLKQMAAAGMLSGLGLNSAQSQEPKATAVGASRSANEQFVVGVMGVNGRGSSLINTFLGQGAKVAYVCDVAEGPLARASKMVADKQGSEPQSVIDFRKILDDKSVDALICAAPNHWHAPATILGCSAGKHVYVEKPCSHNAREGELAVEASRKNKVAVQMGSQRRSRPGIIAAIEKLKSGAIGKLHYARTWYNNRRPEIGHGKLTDPPAWLNWTLWQGPAPERPYKDNVVHYNWHWHWHWGNGELGNNGVHSLDVARWGMGVDYPTQVVSGGAKVRHDDDQETPDTHTVLYNFPDGKTITWEGLSWSPLGPMISQFGTSFHGEDGTLVLFDSGYKIYDMKNKEVETAGGGGGDGEHAANFIECAKNGGRPNADIEDGHKSTLLCHLGNISYRTQKALNTDPKNGRILNDEAAMGLWSREYRPGWEPKV